MVEKFLVGELWWDAIVESEAIHAPHADAVHQPLRWGLQL